MTEMMAKEMNGKDTPSVLACFWRYGIDKIDNHPRYISPIFSFYFS